MLCPNNVPDTAISIQVRSKICLLAVCCFVFIRIYSNYTYYESDEYTESGSLFLIIGRPVRGPLRLISSPRGTSRCPRATVRRVSARKRPDLLRKVSSPSPPRGGPAPRGRGRRASRRGPRMPMRGRSRISSTTSRSSSRPPPGASSSQIRGRRRRPAIPPTAAGGCGGTARDWACS